MSTTDTSTNEPGPAESSTAESSTAESGTAESGTGHESATNRYLEGNYAPVDEEITAVDLPVEGELPAELAGRYLRNGPNPIGDPDPATHHWFLGDGMVHGIRLLDGRAEWYRNRWVGSREVARHRAARAADAGAGGAAGEPAPGPGDIPGPNWSGSGTGPNTSVGGFAGSTWALIEAGGTPVELTYELDTIARNDFFGTLPGAFTAHPKVDPATGEMHAMAYCPYRWGNRVQYVVVGTDGRVDRAVNLELPGSTMLHDMSLTGRWAVVYDQPVILDFERGADGHFPFAWHPEYGNRVGLIPRRGAFETLTDDVIWVDVPLGYTFHPLNAFDRPDGTVVLDLTLYDRMFDADRVGPFECPPRLERWEIDPDRRTVSTTVIDERPNEFPRHRFDRTGRPYRYGYCASPVFDDPAAGWPTVKHDLETGERTVFDHGPGRAAGEPVFVPRAEGGDGAEDDGWLMTYVHDLGAGTAEFVVIDAQEMASGRYTARVPLPQRVPFGFHGNWVSDRSVPPPAPEPAGSTTDAGSDTDTDG